MRIGATDSVQIPSGITATLALIGFTAVIAQVVLMRELVVIFHGNELALGLMLASWFLWTALGSGVLGRITVRVGNSRKLIAVLQGLLAFAFPLSILAARFSKSVFQTLPGEILGPGPMLAASFVVLSVFCSISGCLFAAGSRLYGEAAGARIARATGALYLLEAFGSGIGGILAGFVLLRFLTSFEIASLLALLNVAAAGCLVLQRRSHRIIAVSVLLIVFAAGVFPFAAPRLESCSLGFVWKGFHLLAARNSIYGNLAVVATEGNRSLYENGLVMATAPDPAAAEEAVHYALLQHPSPRTLLLIGGGVNGSLAQALQHPGISRIDYVELDPAILEIARKYFPSESATMDGDLRVHVHATDGRLFLKTAASSFDVIIVNLPDPQTAQLNRFYTVEFFEEAARKLTPGGVFSFRLTGAEDYISPQLAAFLRCIRKSLSEVFAEVAIMPGDPVHFFASSRSGILTLDPGLLVARLRARRLRTSYVREYYIPFRLTPDRLLDLELQTRPQADTRINRDFTPIAYYFDIALWSAHFAPGRRSWFQLMAGVKFTGLATGLGLVLLVLAGLLRRLRLRERRLRAAAGFCVAAMGFTMIALEILLLLAFQSLYGYVYHRLSIIIAAFMAGMALGSWRAQVRQDRGDDLPVGRGDMRSLAHLQGFAALSPVLLVFLFSFLGRIQGPTMLWLSSQILFPALALACGFLGGYQFPLASRIFFADSEPATAPGGLYALDLAGSCIGAIILSIYLVPVFGFLKVASLIALINLAPLALAWLSARDAGSSVV
jgi:spermidine synthase